MSSLSHTNRAFTRNTVRFASSVKFDKQGRIQITSNLLDYSKLQKDVIIIGMVNKIEIWNPKLLNRIDKQTTGIESKEYDELANKIIL